MWAGYSLFSRGPIVGEPVSVSESEYEILKLMASRGVRKGSYRTEELSALLGVERSRLEALVRLLAEKGLLRLSEVEKTVYKPTDEALRYLREGFPEERLVRLLGEKGGEASIEEVRASLGAEANIAIGQAVRKGWVRVENGRVKLVAEPDVAAPERKLLERLVKGEELEPGEYTLLRRRKLVEKESRRTTIVELVNDPQDVLKKVVVEVGALTHSLIRSGRWRQVRLRRYRVDVEPPRLRLGRLHFFQEFIEHIRGIMKELGFIEVEASPVELEFWNYDVLFQPQFHPARSPTDTFYLSQPPRGDLPVEIAERVKRLHEVGGETPGGPSLGWRYSWSPERAARLILRSHTTAVSARVLAERPQPPFRFFTIGRVYRVEKIDARHLPEFHQVDGIASEEGVSLRWLLGMLSEFLERLGINEYKFRPAYFPFTEPSVEGYVRVRGAWLEVLGAGLLRPEVLHSVGVDYPVAAWGMGIERLAMALYGVDDIRMLYARDVGFVEHFPSRWWLYAGSTL